MPSSLVDPNNHVPEVTPEDGWDDIGDWNASPVPPSAILPPKRPSVSDHEEKSHEGFKIEGRLSPRTNVEAKAGLEVREIAREVVKLVTEAPESAKIPRVFTFREKPQIKGGEADTGEGREWGKSNKQSIRWMLGTGIGVASLMVMGLAALPAINESNKARPLPGQTSLVLESEELPVSGIDDLNDLVVRQPEAEQMFRKFASAGVSADFLPFVRDAESLESIIRKNQGAALVSKDWLPKEDCSWEVSRLGDLPCGILIGTLPDYATFRACFISQGNRLLLDWKATTGYGTASFAELAANQGDPTEIRGWLVPSTFHTATFPEADFQCYQLFSPDKQSTLWCYSRKDAPGYSMLAQLFHHGEILQESAQPTAVTLQLEHSPSGALPNQWLIGKMLHKEWISP